MLELVTDDYCFGICIVIHAKLSIKMERVHSQSGVFA